MTIGYFMIKIFDLRCFFDNDNDKDKDQCFLFLQYVT